MPDNHRQYPLPLVKIVQVSSDNDGVVTELCIEEDSNHYFRIEPIAPATLGRGKEWRVGNGESETFQLHRLITKNKDTLTFRTFSDQQKLPAVGGEYRFVSNFTPDQFDLVRDTNKVWEKKPFPENVTFCDLTYEPIPGKDHLNTVGYTDGKAWITNRAYDTYIKKDILRVRGSS